GVIGSPEPTVDEHAHRPSDRTAIVARANRCFRRQPPLNSSHRRRPIKPRKSSSKSPQGRLCPSHADVVLVYPSRAEFAAQVPPANLLAGGRDVRAAEVETNPRAQVSSCGER